MLPQLATCTSISEERKGGCVDHSLEEGGYRREAHSCRPEMPFWNVTIPDAQRVSGEFMQSWGRGLGKGSAERSFFLCNPTFSGLSRRECAEAPESWDRCVGQPTSRDRVPLCHQ